MQITREYLTLETATGPMQCQLFRPVDNGRQFPALLFYSEIFQITAPIARTAAMLAGQDVIGTGPAAPSLVAA